MSHSDNIFREEINLCASTSSIYVTPDQFQPDYVSTYDGSNIGMTTQSTSMELKNIKLCKELDQTRIELKGMVAANESLKVKVAQLYVEIQSVLLERQKLNNKLTDMSNRLNATQILITWYQSQLHSLEAAKKILQTEVYTYQGILKHRQKAIVDITASYKQLSADYMVLTQKYEEDKQKLKDELNDIILQNVSNEVHSLPVTDAFESSHVSDQLGITEEELYNVKTELRVVEQQLLASEIAKVSMQNVANQQGILISSMEKTIQTSEDEKSKIANVLNDIQLDVFKLRSENINMQKTLLSSKKEQKQIKDAILLLQSQLCKMITQYRILKCKNFDAEEKLSTMQSIISENKCLRTLLREASNLLFQKLNEEKQKLTHPELKFSEAEMYEQLFQMKNKAESSLQECLKQVIIRNKDLREQLKTLDKTYDENIDEGYGDNSIISSVFTDIPTTVPINSVLLNSASKLLLKSKNLLSPIEIQVKTLKTKMEQFRYLYAFIK